MRRTPSSNAQHITQRTSSLILGAAVFVVGILSIVVGVRSASASLLENIQASVQETYAQVQESFETARDVYEDNKDRFLQARQSFQQAAESVQLPTLLNQGKEYLTNMTTVASEYTSMLRTRVEAADGMTDEQKATIISILDADREYFQERLQAYKQTVNRERFNELAAELRVRWEERQQQFRQYVTHLKSAKVQEGIAALATVIERVKAKRDQLIDEERSVEQIEELLTELEALYAQAQEKYQAAVELIDDLSLLNDTSRAEAQITALLTEAAEVLSESQQQLRKIITTLKEYRTIALEGTGEVRVEGNGTAILLGQGTVSGNITRDAQLRIRRGSALVEVTGGTQRSEGGHTIYEDFSSFSVSGADLVISLSGVGASLSVYGSGHLIIRGTGTVTLGQNDPYTIPQRTGEVTIQLSER